MMPTIDAPAPSAAIDLEVMREHATQVVTTLKLLGNADRLLLLCQLAQQERTVGDLEQLTGVTQPTLSQQLGILRREGVAANVLNLTSPRRLYERWRAAGDGAAPAGARGAQRSARCSRALAAYSCCS